MANSTAQKPQTVKIRVYKARTRLLNAILRSFKLSADRPSAVFFYSGRSANPREISAVVMAERGRFELPEPVKVQRFSRPPQSTTLPPLRDNSIVQRHHNHSASTSYQTRHDFTGAMG